MTPGDVDELRVVARGPDREGMADRPDGETGEPEPKAQADRTGERAIDDREAARRAAEQDRFGQRPMDRRAETRHLAVAAHQTRAPTPKETKNRKKLDATQALDRPETNRTRRRKPPDRSTQAKEGAEQRITQHETE